MAICCCVTSSPFFANKPRVRRIAALTLAGVLPAIGFWFGEGTSLLQSALPIAVGLFGSSTIAYIAPEKPRFKVLGGFVLLAVYAVAFILGSHSFTRAFNECVERGDEVRVQLSEYRQKNGQFPDRLSLLEGDGLCGCITRSTLLKYERTTDGYILIFKDWLVTHTATESDPFFAHK